MTDSMALSDWQSSRLLPKRPSVTLDLFRTHIRINLASRLVQGVAAYKLSR
jgi:hypothetical protein